MADNRFSFQVFLDKYPQWIAEGNTLWGLMTQAEKDAFNKNPAAPTTGLEIDLFFWGEQHFPFSYSKEYAVPEWQAWYTTVPPGTRLLLYAAAASQSDNTDLKSSIGADVLPRWVWQPTKTGDVEAWRTMINPIRELKDRIYARLKIGTPAPSPVVQPPVEQNTPGTVPAVTIPAPSNSFTDTPAATTTGGLKKVDPSSLSGQIIIGVIVALIVAFLASRS
jgi:hypothetical protein